MFSVIGMVLLVLLDSFLYGFIFESREMGIDRGRGIFGLRIFDVIYEKLESFWGLVFKTRYGIPVRYRIIQKVTEAAVLVAVFIYGGIWEAIGMVWGFYWLLNDYGYFVLMGQLWYARELKYDNWLSHWSRSGLFMLRPYGYWKFRLSALIGAIGLIWLSIIGK